VPAVTVERLTLRVPGRSAADGERLAHAVAERLRALDGAAGVAPALRVRLRARAGEDVDQLAGRIVAEIALQLGRTLG
jgi:hypothetical protein